MVHRRPHRSQRVEDEQVLDVRERALDAGLRIGDRDRQRVAAVLGEAAAGGYLGRDEVDERLGLVWSASRRGELVAVTADLPAEASRTPAQAAAVGGRGSAGGGRAAHPAPYAALLLLLVAVWLGMGINGAGWYPWPIWPALGWGLAARCHLRAAVAARRPA